MTITAAADGSALGNPGPAGWAWYVDDDCWAAGGWPHGTNNMGELRAVLELFRATEHVDDDLHILCDSKYVIDSITKWMPGWKKKGWKKGDGKPVMNLDLMQEIDEAIAGRKYRFEWVKGHVGHRLNEAADIRARTAAEAYQRKSPVPEGPGWTGAGATAVTQAVEAAGSHEATEPELFADLEAEETRSAPVFDAEDDGALFSLEPEPVWHSLSLEITADEQERLARRAREQGTSVQEFLRGLI
ncbi:MAG TPA: RNase H family protein [Plantibacter sp.]|uniref:RNase H family protein n=1 Tax=unclassified Plantibacter TaxID=2624265 RepID=UPI002D19D7F3|nr:RNase H family protein [Plantibacter sp.]